MIGPRTPESLSIAGSLKLANQIVLPINEKSSANQLLTFVAELLFHLLRLDSVQIELPQQCHSSPVRLSCSGGSLNGRFRQTCVIPLSKYPSGQLELVGSRSPSEWSFSDAAFLELVLASLSAKLDALFEAPPQNFLTPAEQRVLNSLHLPTPEIMTRLSIGDETLRTHIKRIFKKLNVHSRSEAIQKRTLNPSLAQFH
ncbi:MAG TPA: helix-turn-helix transcriptional regulator [Pantanalinema sp.]